MNRRSFIRSIAVVGFGNLFLPRALDRFKWKATAEVESEWFPETLRPIEDFIRNPDYVNAPFEMRGCSISGDPIGFWMPYPLRFKIPVVPSNREEIERHSIPPFIRVPRV